MKTLHAYLTRQMLATLGMTVFVFTLVLLLGNAIKEVLTLVVNREATIGLAFHAIVILIPWVLAYSLPIGMLTAALLVFGRFSADQELTAARASGISLISLISPILFLSVLVSALCAWLNFDIAPASRIAYKELLYNAGINGKAHLLQSGQTVRIADHAIWVGKVAADGTNLDNVIVSQYDKQDYLQRLIKSPSGTIATDLAHGLVTLTLHDPNTMFHDQDGWRPGTEGGDATYPIKVPVDVTHLDPPSISDMTFNQLMDKRDEIDRAMAQSPARNLTKAQLIETQKNFRQMSVDESTPLLVYMHRAAAFSFACVGFTLVGIPLGIRGHRRETSVGIAIALVLMLVYYSFVVLGQAWANHPERAPQLIVWLPNFIFQAVGAVLIWRANRGV